MVSNPTAAALSARPAVTLIHVTITYNDVMKTGNPFIYGEIVTSAAFADRDRKSVV